MFLYKYFKSVGHDARLYYWGSWTFTDWKKLKLTIRKTILFLCLAVSNALSVDYRDMSYYSMLSSVPGLDIHICSLLQYWYTCDYSRYLTPCTRQCLKEKFHDVTQQWDLALSNRAAGLYVSWIRSRVQTERSEVCTHDRGQNSPIQTDLARLIRYLLYGRQENLNSFNVTKICLADILLANGDVLKISLPKFARPLYFFFSHQAFWHFY